MTDRVARSLRMQIILKSVRNKIILDALLLDILIPLLSLNLDRSVSIIFAYATSLRIVRFSKLLTFICLNRERSTVETLLRNLVEILARGKAPVNRQQSGFINLLLVVWRVLRKFGRLEEISPDKMSGSSE
ncbi:hypothetical protein Zmor_002012 [Zophobas morio]|uniref:Uncharacterized protein n=1 Tax=Zophobas morio TaxID=2755281 RepID=A0AA38MPR6_9CUCU|nr:hypothetical protein Zmor_002012 [Zophobas morio]